MSNLGGRPRSHYGLENHGLAQVKNAYWNLPVSRLIEESIARGEGKLSVHGPLVVETGKHTGRSANDRFVVKEPSTEGQIWWGNVNVPYTEEQFDAVHKRMCAYLEDKDVFVRDCFVGADPQYRLPVRIINEYAWHNMFAYNMFLEADEEQLARHVPEFTVINVPSFRANPAVDGTNSETCILVNFAKKLVLVGGTSYAGETKKSIFSVMNFLLPQQGVFPMHSSANIGPKGNTTVFFGLSGTGKTTLSADASRTLIGDDEHGWSDNGVFNFEGGCYAKVINLSQEAEPEIYATTRRFGTVLENVIMDDATREIDLNSANLTENTRGSYPIDQIPNASDDGLGGQPTNLVFLTCDAFGVLPPVSKLTPAQAMYHFINGYTAKVAGTEKGVKEPVPAFSPCYGGPFMPLHPFRYAELLKEKIDKHNTTVWLINTGWSGGGYGKGERMSIAHTRAIINAALDGNLAQVPTRQHPIFGLAMPTECPGVPAEVLDPRNTWSDKEAYDRQATMLAQKFAENFAKYADEVSEEVKAAGPIAA